MKTLAVLLLCLLGAAAVAHAAPTPNCGVMTVRGRFTDGLNGALELGVIAPGGKQSVYHGDGTGVVNAAVTIVPGGWGIEVMPHNRAAAASTWEVTVDLPPQYNGAPGQSYKLVGRGNAAYSFVIGENCAV